MHNRRLSERIADLYMIMTCVLDKQYTPPGFELKRDATILDIGGHIGSFAIWAGKTAPDGRVFVFEPNPDTFALLEKNIAANTITNVIPAPVAVSGAKSTRTFYASTMNTAESGFYNKGATAKQITVESLALNDIFRQYDISSCDFLKLDCEGAEYEILFTAPAECLGRIQVIAMECHNPAYFNISNPDYTQESMKQFLQKNNYIVREVKENAMHSLIFARRSSQKNGI